MVCCKCYVAPCIVKVTWPSINHLRYFDTFIKLLFLNTIHKNQVLNDGNQLGFNYYLRGQSKNILRNKYAYLEYEYPSTYFPIILSSVD